MKASVKLRSGETVNISGKNISYQTDSMGVLVVQDGRAGKALGAFGRNHWAYVTLDYDENEAVANPQDDGEIAVPRGWGAVVAEFYSCSNAPTGFVIIRGHDGTWRTQEGTEIDDGHEFVRERLNRKHSSGYCKVICEGA